ncbi:MAG TPA: Ig-like domain-containing protein, partial [Rubrobacter sp.]|nr:Ig-like domain-containing protein [Rubrobacter sp.]
MGRQWASDGMRDSIPSRFWWALIVCLLLVGAGGVSAAFAAVINSDPVAKDNSYRVHKGTTLTRPVPGVLNNDIDPDGDKLSVTRDSSPRHGKLSLKSNGSFVYKPNERYRGMDSFTYTARDGNGGTDTAKVEITVWPVSVPPLARNDVYRVNEEKTLTVPSPGVLRNDAEVDGRRLLAKKVSDPTHGSVDLSPDGSFVYIPETDFNGEDSFIYRAADRTGRGDRATVSISVNNVAPTATLGNGGAVDEGSPATITFSNPSDPSNADTTAGFRYEYHCDGSAFTSGPDYASASTNDSTTCTFDDDGTHQVRARIMDKDDGASEYTTDVTVNNVKPTVTLSGPSSVQESTTVEREYTFTVTDPGDDTFEVEPGFPTCGSNGTLVNDSLVTDASGGSFKCVFPDGDTTSNVAIKVKDSDGLVDTD